MVMTGGWFIIVLPTLVAFPKSEKNLGENETCSPSGFMK
jgi:hypothetical protein